MTIKRIFIQHPGISKLLENADPEVHLALPLLYTYFLIREGFGDLIDGDGREEVVVETLEDGILQTHIETLYYARLESLYDTLNEIARTSPSLKHIADLFRRREIVAVNVHPPSTIELVLLYPQVPQA